MDAKLAERTRAATLGDLPRSRRRRLRAGRDGDRARLRRPRLLERTGVKMDQIDLWELNEAFAVQVPICRDKLGIRWRS